MEPHILSMETLWETKYKKKMEGTLCYSRFVKIRQSSLDIFQTPSKRALKMVFEWYGHHIDELLINWNLALTGICRKKAIKKNRAISIGEQICFCMLQKQHIWMNTS
jgi:hypothetical protein